MQIYFHYRGGVNYFPTITSSLSILLFLIIFLLPVISNSQEQVGSCIYGNIIDAETREPIAYANIFISSSSIGAASDENGYFELRNIPHGRYEIIASVLGYELLKAEVRMHRNSKRNFRFEMYKQPIEMKEVVVIGKRSFKRRRQLAHFRKNFLGSSQNGKKSYIKNEEVIRFEEKGDMLLAYAYEPLEIINNGLGYKIFYVLEEYIKTPEEIKFTGYDHFIGQTATTYHDSVDWLENRKKTYMGSQRHFLTTICENYEMTNGDTTTRPIKKDWGDIIDYRTKVTYADSSHIEDEGFFVIQMKYLQGPNKFRFSNLVNTNWFLSEAENENEMYLKFDIFLQVEYDNEFYPFNRLTGESRRRSWIQLTCDSTILDKKGRCFDKYAIQTRGLWSNERVADMLPFDYKLKKE